MADSLVFESNHPVTIRWINESGLEVARRGRLHRITSSELAVMLERPLEESEGLRRGDHVSTEAGEYHGKHLTVFHGSVVAVESRLLRVAVDGGVEVLQRRRFPRAKLAYRFATAVHLSTDMPRFFVAKPIDLSGGGARLSHRLPMKVGDRFRLIVRLTRNTMVAPIAEVIETWEQAPGPFRWVQPSRFVSRAIFVELTPRERHLITGYVAKVLETFDRLQNGSDQPAAAAGSRS